MVSRLDDPTIDVLEELRRERQMNKLSNRMNQFHTYFKTQFNMIYQLSDGSFGTQRLSLQDFLQLIDDLIHHLTMHHTIEERVLFPVLGARMPQFSEEETRGEHLESHRKIHDGLDKLSELTKKWSSEPSAYSPSELKDCLDGFRQVLFRHLDDEVSDLRGENLAKYFSPEEVEGLPLYERTGRQHALYCYGCHVCLYRSLTWSALYRAYTSFAKALQTASEKRQGHSPRHVVIWKAAAAEELRDDYLYHAYFEYPYPLAGVRVEDTTRMQGPTGLSGSAGPTPLHAGASNHFKNGRSASIPALLLLPVSVHSATYNAIKEYSGPTFLDDWEFYGNFDDKMNGDVDFVTADEGVSEKLAYVDPNTNRAILKVDNVTNVPYNEKRKAVRITSKDSYDVGSLWVADILHAPYGCSVWPAFWSFAKDAQWPQGGEIDSFEGINLHPTAQMGLHTDGSAQCAQVNPDQLSTLVNSTDCAGTNNAGCMVTNTNPNSYGAAFAQQQGGVFITEFAESGISIWFFSRQDIPQSVTQGATSLDTLTLGKPMGNWPAPGCDIRKAFQPQNLVFTVTLCGDFARPENIFHQTCSGDCYLDWVIKDPTAYDNAYFDISYVKVFSSNPSATTLSSGGNGTPTQTGQSSTNSNAAEKMKAALLAIPMAFSAALTFLMS